MKIKKYLAFAIAFIMLCSAVPAHATDSMKVKSPNVDVKELNAFLDAATPKTLPPISEEEETFAVLWEQIKQNGYMEVNKDGLIIINADAEKLASDNKVYNYFMGIVDTANYSISVGLIRMNSYTLQLENVVLTEATLNKIAECEANIYEVASENEVPKIGPQAEPHDCNNPTLNLGYLVYTNYNTIRNYYNDMIALQRTNPDLDPWLTTVGYWIGYIREGGPWDYKVKIGPYNKIYCCGYSNLTKQHRDAEWIGNYNYGYTGSILFGLNMLHAGSYAAGKFKSTDLEDWPAIDEGYYNAF